MLRITRSNRFPWIPPIQGREHDGERHERRVRRAGHLDTRTSASERGRNARRGWRNAEGDEGGSHDWGAMGVVTSPSSSRYVVLLMARALLTPYSDRLGNLWSVRQRTGNQIDG